STATAFASQRRRPFAGGEFLPGLVRPSAHTSPTEKARQREGSSTRTEEPCCNPPDIASRQIAGSVHSQNKTKKNVDCAGPPAHARERQLRKTPSVRTQAEIPARAARRRWPPGK